MKWHDRRMAVTLDDVSARRKSVWKVPLAAASMAALRILGRTIATAVLHANNCPSILARPLCEYFQRGIWPTVRLAHLNTTCTSPVCVCPRIGWLCCNASWRTLHSQRSTSSIAPFSPLPGGAASVYANHASNDDHDDLYHAQQTPAHAACWSSFAKVDSKSNSI